MRKKRDPENDAARSTRLKRRASERIQQVSAEDKALDVAVRESIKRYGP
jgi:hypothetical protein